MTAFLAKVLDALVKMLPAVLVLALLGAAALHVLTATRIDNRIDGLERQRIRALEEAKIEQGAQLVHVLAALQDLATEVRGYRDDMRAENKALKARVLAGAGKPD